MISAGSTAFLTPSSGIVVVDGAGSTWSNNTSLSVGEFGSGSLMILDGGGVTANDCSLGGAFGGSSGSVLVDGTGSSLSCDQGLLINGGSLSVQNGGAVCERERICEQQQCHSRRRGFNVDYGSGLCCSVRVGNLTVRNGAILTSDDLAYIGGSPFPGYVTVDGPGSRWNHDFDQVQLYVGFGSLGVLDITNGGAVSTFAAGVGTEGGDNGQLLVDGSGSTLDVRTNLSIGGGDFGNGPVPGGIGLAQITNGGAINSETTTVFGQGTIVDDGTLTTTSLALSPGGLLSGNGNVSGDVDSAGQIAPGDSLGTLAIVGNLTQEAVGKLVFEISGTSSDAQGHLSITGNATLNGTVEVRFMNGFLPLQGQVFDLIDVTGSISGSFAQVIFPDLRSGFQFSTQLVNGHYQITALGDGAPATGLLNVSTRGQVGVGNEHSSPGSS